MDGEGGEAYVCRCAIFAWMHSYADGLALSQRRQARLASGHSFVPFPQPAVEPASLGSAAAGPGRFFLGRFLLFSRRQRENAYRTDSRVMRRTRTNPKTVARSCLGCVYCSLYPVIVVNGL
jgi:hypothetical protein